MPLRTITITTADTSPRKNPSGWPHLQPMEEMDLHPAVTRPQAMSVTMTNVILGSVMAKEGPRENLPAETENVGGQGVGRGTESTAVGIDPKGNTVTGNERGIEEEDVLEVVLEKGEWIASAKGQEVRVIVDHPVVIDTKKARRINAKKVITVTLNVKLRRNPKITLNNNQLLRN